ncbi:MAG: acyltransferase [Candidatus Omnitrophica bacterium]|nr:acyltransferase [Candidatus Omnitrophota bacterium]
MNADELIGAHMILRDKIKKEFKRVLPFGDEISDRWEKARYLGFGEGSSIYDSSVVLGDVVVKENTWIGPYTVLDGEGGLVIGANCSVSAGVQIYTHDSVKWAVSGGRHPYEHAPVKIGDCCYIGPNTIIRKGITIGDHCVIGANSYVNRDIPGFSIAFGSPCEPVGTVVISEGGGVEFHYNRK